MILRCESKFVVPYSKVVGCLNLFFFNFSYLGYDFTIHFRQELPVMFFLTTIQQYPVVVYEYCWVIKKGFFFICIAGHKPGTINFRAELVIKYFQIISNKLPINIQQVCIELNVMFAVCFIKI